MSNTLTVLQGKLLAQGLMALREMAIMPRLVNIDFGTEAAQKGAAITIPIPSAVSAGAVTPAATPPSTSDQVPTSATITMDQWYEAAFYLSDKDMMEAKRDVIPMEASEAIRALANQVDADIFSKAAGVYGYVGTAGTTPFAADTTAATSVRRVLNNQLAPKSDRRMVIDSDAEANALNLRAFQDASFSGSIDAIVNGEINKKLGFTWASEQNVPTHTAGTITTGLAAKTSTAQAVGLKAVVCTTAASTGACALLAGDIVTFSGQSQTYVLTAAATQASAATDVTLNIEPGLVVALAGDEAVSVKGDHVMNLGFHRDAFALAVRPLQDSAQGLGNQIMQATDPVSGLSLRLEVSREYKRTRWSYDILWGSALVRRELACRLAG